MRHFIILLLFVSPLFGKIINSTHAVAVQQVFRKSDSTLVKAVEFPVENLREIVTFAAHRQLNFLSTVDTSRFYMDWKAFIYVQRWDSLGNRSTMFPLDRTTVLKTRLNLYIQSQQSIE